MRIVPLLLACLAASPLLAVDASPCGLPATRSVSSAALLRWVWGSPQALTANQDFAGPGLYTQTLSVTGLSGTIGSLAVWADVRGDFPAAWSFLGFPPNANCIGHPALSVVPFVAGTETVPGASVAVRSDMDLCLPPSAMISVTITIDPPFTFDPAKRYGLATLSFDHSASVVGAGDASHCGGAETGLCFVTSAGEVATTELPGLTWQGGGSDCFGIVRARATTWGALKTIYR